MHDYRPRWGQRADEVYRDIAWPRAINGTPAVARDEQTLVDAIEGAERRRDATILRDIQLALADELPLEVLPTLVEETARELAERYHTIAMWVIHPPEARGDRRNVHAHILLCTRRLDAMGDGFGRKLRILDDRRTGPHEIVWMRNRWCELVNGRLARSGSEARIYPGRRLDAPPMPTVARRYVARAHKRAGRRERLAARREGRQAVPIRKRVAELATLGKPANRAMGEIARHVAAGYDVPESERKYETRARTRYDRAEEYDQAKRDATHYASLPVVCEELAAVNAELDSLEHRIDAHRAVRETDFARAEPVTRVAVVPPVAPPFLEADVVEGASGVAPRIEFEPGAMAEPSAPEPVTPPAPASVVVPVALEEDGRKHDLGLKLLAEAADSARPEPVTRVAVVPPVAPPFLDADIVEDASGVAPRIEFEPGAMAEPSAPEPVTPPAPASVVVPVALGEDGRKHDLGLKLRLAVGFDATGEPACPDPIARRVVAPIQAPAALGDESGDREPDLEERVEQVAIFYEARDRETRQIAVKYSHPEVCAGLVEEAMRWQMGETPGPMPRLFGIPRDSDANQLCAGAWGRALRSELDELRSFGGDRERIEPHIERVCTRARTDDAWRGRILDTFARFVAPRYVLDLGAAELADRDPAQREARAATGERLRRLFAEGGIDAWYEQTVARAAGLKVDWSFGELTRSRASGLIAEDTLRLLLLPSIRDAQSLCRAFPRRSAGRADATTLGEWHGRLVRLVSGLRQHLSQPKVHEALIDETVESMLPDVYLEQMRGGLSRGPTKRGPPTLADRDRALRELTRQRARDAGLGDDFDVSRGRASAVRQPAGESREVDAEYAKVRAERETISREMMTELAEIGAPPNFDHTTDPAIAKFVTATREHIAHDARAIGETWIRARMMGDEVAEDLLDEYLDEQGGLGRAIEVALIRQVVQPWGRNYRNVAPDKILARWQERYDADPDAIHQEVWSDLHQTAQAAIERRAKGEPEPHPTQYAEATRKRRQAATDARSEYLRKRIADGAEDMGAWMIEHDADPRRFPAPSGNAWIRNTAAGDAAEDAIGKDVAPYFIPEQYRWGFDDLVPKPESERVRDDLRTKAVIAWRQDFQPAARRIVQAIHDAVWPTYRDAAEHDYVPDQRPEATAQPERRRRRRHGERRPGPETTGPDDR